MRDRDLKNGPRFSLRIRAARGLIFVASHGKQIALLMHGAAIAISLGRFKRYRLVTDGA
jgi:hypothetical protein